MPIKIGYLTIIIGIKESLFVFKPRWYAPKMYTGEIRGLYADFLCVYWENARIIRGLTDCDFVSTYLAYSIYTPYIFIVSIYFMYLYSGYLFVVSM